MDELETDDPLPDKSTDSEEETEPPITLTAALQNIIYDPKSYLLGNLTEEEAYSSYKVCCICGCLCYTKLQRYELKHTYIYFYFQDLDE